MVKKYRLIKDLVLQNIYTHCLLHVDKDDKLTAGNFQVDELYSEMLK